MERLKLRLWAVAAVTMLMGIAFSVAPRPSQTARTEDWIGQQLPTDVGTFRMEANRAEPSNTSCTYKMDKSTYDTLKPWGIVARVYSNGRESYDVVVIGSNNKESFHDPKVCFGAQAWNLGPERTENIETKTRGTVPVTLVEMTKGSTKTFAVYFYKSVNSGFIASNSGVKMAMLTHKIKSFGQNDEGAFIRIIPSYDMPSLDKLKVFIGEWLDATGSTSKGYY